MAITEIFDRLACQCDVCGHVWLCRYGVLPSRCADIKKRCREWNSKNPGLVVTKGTTSVHIGKKSEPIKDVVYETDDYSQNF